MKAGLFTGRQHFPTYFLFPNLWVVCWSLLGESLLAFRLLTTIVLYVSNINSIYKNFSIALKIPHTIHYVSETNCLLLQVNPLVSFEEKNSLVPNHTVWSTFMTSENFLLIHCFLSQQSGILWIYFYDLRGWFLC